MSTNPNSTAAVISFDHAIAMAFVAHGIGTMVYGERDYWPDGSHVTTEWFVIAWLPIIPLCSKRISYTKNSDYAKYDAREGFYVYETMGVDRKQTLYVYLWLASVVVPFVVLFTFQHALGKMLGDEDRAAGVCLAIAATAFVFPLFVAAMGEAAKSQRVEASEFRASRVKSANV